MKTIYSENEYRSNDLDFVTPEPIKDIGGRMVASRHPVDLALIETWAARERAIEKYEIFLRQLNKQKSKPR